MSYFIIGDLHGCYYTLLKMLGNWNSESECLIFAGDLIDRGNFSVAVVIKCIELTEKNGNCLVIKGNHEAEFIEYFEKGENENWTRQCGQKTLENFTLERIDSKMVLDWFKKMPLSFETASLLVTHAGISETENPYEENNEDGVLWNRKELKNMGKLQIHGHTPLLKNKPQFNENSNSWNIDTGAYYGYGLTGLKVSEDGKLLAIITVETDKKDIQ